MIENLTRQHIATLFRQALTKGLIREEDTAVMFHDLDYLASRIAYLKACFPGSALHGIAIKSNPLLSILEFTCELGTGVEAATTGEIATALKAGYSPNRIVFDSPVKTHADLLFAMKLGVHVNCDNLDELKRVDLLLNDTDTSSSFGIRINPQVGVGAILESSVAGEYSKFGVPLNSKRSELEAALLSYPWLTGVHLHVGSQGCPIEMLVEGVGILYDFVVEINKKRKANRSAAELGEAQRAKSEKRIDSFDIGGGLPISYSYQQRPPRMEDYAAMLQKRAPKLFFGQADKRTSEEVGGWRIITEFGRWVYVNSGWTVSRVEYVKRDPGINTAMIHVGADLLVRECLNPADWRHEYTVLDAKGNIKEGREATPYNLAGPLCFAGDIVAKGVSLPAVEEGDYLVIHDTGGYTFSMWSRYNSRQTPRILGFQGGNFTILKEREGLDDLVRFWM